MRPKPKAKPGLATATSAILVFSFLTALYSMTYSGTYRVDDEHILMARAQSLALWGDFSNPQVYGNDRVRELENLEPPFAAQATSIEPAQTFLAALLYRWGRAIDVGGAQAAFTLNLYATAFTGAVVLLTVCALGYDLRTATWCALLFGVGTMAWPYAKTFYRDSLAMAMIALAFLGYAMAFARRGAAGIVGLALIAFGGVGGILTKNTSTAIVMALAVGGFLVWLRHLKDGNRISYMPIVGVLFPLLLLVSAATLLSSTGIMARYTVSYYSGLVQHFLSSLKPSLVVHSLGPFLSPAKSIFLFSPLLLALPFSVRKGWSKIWWFATPVLLGSSVLAVAQAMFYRDAWAGTFGWGLRFMLPAIPLLAVLCAPASAELYAVGHRHKLAALRSLAIASLAVQLAGALSPWFAPYEEWLQAGLDPYTNGAAWLPRFLSIPNQILSIPDIAGWDVAWSRTAASDQKALLVPIAGSLLVMGCLTLVRSLLRAGGRLRTGALIMTGILGAGSTALPLTASLLLTGDPAVAGDQPEIRAAVSWVQEQAEPGDLVVIDAYGTSLWRSMMNLWSDPVPWFSLPLEVPHVSGSEFAPVSAPSDATKELFESIDRTHVRILYVTSLESPDHSTRREVDWLASNHDRVAHTQVWAGTVVKVHLFEWLGEE